MVVARSQKKKGRVPGSRSQALALQTPASASCADSSSPSIASASCVWPPSASEVESPPAKRARLGGAVGHQTPQTSATKESQESQTGKLKEFQNTDVREALKRFGFPATLTDVEVAYTALMKRIPLEERGSPLDALSNRITRDRDVLLAMFRQKWAKPWRGRRADAGRGEEGEGKGADGGEGGRARRGGGTM